MSKTCIYRLSGRMQIMRTEGLGAVVIVGAMQCDIPRDEVARARWQPDGGGTLDMTEEETCKLLELCKGGILDGPTEQVPDHKEVPTWILD